MTSQMPRPRPAPLHKSGLSLPVTVRQQTGPLDSPAKLVGSPQSGRGASAVSSASCTSTFFDSPAAGGSPMSTSTLVASPASAGFVLASPTQQAQKVITVAASPKVATAAPPLQRTLTPGSLAYPAGFTPMSRASPRVVKVTAVPVVPGTPGSILKTFGPAAGVPYPPGMGFTPAAAQLGLCRRASFGFSAEQAEAEKVAEEPPSMEVEDGSDAVLARELLLCFRDAVKASTPEEAGLILPSPGWLRTEPAVVQCSGGQSQECGGNLDEMPLPRKAKVVDAPSGPVRRPHDAPHYHHQQQHPQQHQQQHGYWQGQNQQDWQAQRHGGGWRQHGQGKGGWNQWNGYTKKAWPQYPPAGEDAQATATDGN